MDVRELASRNKRQARLIDEMRFTYQRDVQALVLAEREACAKVCDQHAENQARHGEAALAEQSRQDAVAIRARSNVKVSGPAHE